MHTPRRIRSFVLRAGRVTAGQERALLELWPRYGIESGSAPLDLDEVFGRRAPRRLEIGFGVGEVIGSLALAQPDIDHLGIEVHRAGVGRLLLRAEQDGCANLRILCQDAVEVLEQRIADGSFDEMLIFFPDPWHKKRHHKRRLIDARFVDLLAAKLRVGGILRLATDWQDYAVQMLAVCNAATLLESLSADRTYVPRRRGQLRIGARAVGAGLGHGGWDLAYSRRAPGGLLRAPRTARHAARARDLRTESCRGCRR